MINFKARNTYSYCFLAFLLSIPLLGKTAPQVAHLNEVSACQYLTDIDVNSGYGKQQDWRSLTQYNALKKAEHLSATHIVWVALRPIGGFNGEALAKAYRCQ